METKEPFHVVLGANGVIGQGIIAELTHRGIPCKGSGRSQSKDWIRADLTDAAATKSALKTASHCYITAGLAYKTDVWKRDWPKIMRNVIDAAATHNVKVAFFDNIYMYGPPPLQDPITEDHPQHPTSKKGAVRKEIADMLMHAHCDNKIRAFIGRAPDFYGAHAVNSPAYIMILSKILEGKKPQWLGNPNLKHSFIHVNDAAKSMVELALDDGAYGEVWHLPTASPALSVAEVHYLMAELANSKAKLSSIPKPLLALLKPFVPLLAEVGEVAYQYYSDYNFSSAKFQKRYPDFPITPYVEGIKDMVHFFKK